MKKLLLILLCLPMIGFGQPLRIVFYNDELKEVNLEEPELVYNYLEIYEENDGTIKGELFYADRKRNDRSITFRNINERAGKIRGEGTILKFNQSDFNKSIFKEWTKYDIEGKIMHKVYNISYDKENQTWQQKRDDFLDGKLNNQTTYDFEILPDGSRKILRSFQKIFDKEYNFEYYYEDAVLQLPYTRVNLNDDLTTSIWNYDFTKDNEYLKRALEIKSKVFEINDQGVELYNSDVTLFLENFKKTVEDHKEFNLNVFFSHPDWKIRKDASATLRIGDYDHLFSIQYEVGSTISKCSVTFKESIRGMNIKNKTISYDENQLKVYANSNRITINLIKDKIYFAVNETVVASSDYFGGFSDINLSSYSKTPVIIKNVTAMVDGYSDIKLNNNKTEWTGNGSGFFISTSGYIVTNHHVIDKASEIEVEFKYRNEIKGFNATVIQTDAINDLAILKIDDDDFSYVGTLPYAFRTRSVDVGTDVFALGYPKALTIMGKEIKFTDGRISSKTGFKGDITTYQSTTPIQPGNSGGPLFDFKGNLIGINNAKIITEDVEGVSYSIKSSYLLNLIDVLPETIPLPSSTQLASKPLTEQIKILSDYVVLIKVK